MATLLCIKAYFMCVFVNMCDFKVGLNFAITGDAIVTSSAVKVE